jgi:hypothetical protein
MLVRGVILSFALVLAACSQPAEEAPTPAPAPDVTAAPLSAAVVDVPQSGARVTSPLTVTGTAPAGWFFENQFPVRLLDAQGAEIALAPAHPRVNWTEPGDKEFDAIIAFNVTRETAATLVLEQDMPPEDGPTAQVRIPVTLLPAQ